MTHGLATMMRDCDLDEWLLDDCPLCTAVPPEFANLPALCPTCLERCRRSIEEDARIGCERALGALPRPVDIAAGLGRTVAGLDAARRALAVIAYNHVKRLVLRPWGGEGLLPGRSSVLVTGAPGSGKTHLVQSLCAALALPCVTVDASSLMATGSVAEAVGGRLRAQQPPRGAGVRPGLLFLDGLEALCDGHPLGLTAQYGLLGLLEGRTLSVGLPDGSRVDLPTDDLLIVAAGSTATQAGLIPALRDRFSLHVEMPEPDAAQLLNLLRDPGAGFLARYARRLSLDGVELVVTPAAESALIRETLREGGGARGLQRALEGALQPAMYLVPAWPDLERIWLNAADDALYISLSAPHEDPAVNALSPFLDANHRPNAYHDELISA